MSDYDTDKNINIAANNSANVAAMIVAAQIGEGGMFDAAEYDAIRKVVFEGTLALTGIGMVSEVFEGGNATAAPAPQYQPPAGRSNGNGSTVVKGGKFAGKTFDEISAIEPGYLTWMAEKSNNDFLKREAQKYLAA